MVIDDNEFDLFLFEKLFTLKEVAHTVLKFNYAGDALLFLKEASAEEWPELIVLDIHMPVMTGFDFLDEYENIRRLKNGRSNILMISSSLDKEDNRKADESDLVFALLNKPVNMEVVEKHLNEMGYY